MTFDEEVCNLIIPGNPTLPVSTNLICAKSILTIAQLKWAPLEQWKITIDVFGKTPKAACFAQLNGNSFCCSYGHTLEIALANLAIKIWNRVEDDIDDIPF